MAASGWLETVRANGKRKYRVHWYDTHPDGRRKHRSRTFEDRNVAERFQAHVRLRTSTPTEIRAPERVSVGWIVEKLWKPTQKRLAPTTRQKNRHLIAHTSSLWKAVASDLTVRQVEALWGELLEKPLARSTVSAVRIQLAMAFDEAVKDEKLTRNVVKMSSVPQVSGLDHEDDERVAKPEEVLSDAEVARLIDSAPAWAVLPLEVLAFTGMRQGEACALRCRNWTGTHLIVERGWRRTPASESSTGSYGELARTKTRDSKRELLIPERLRPLLDAAAAGREPDEPLLRAPEGGQLLPDNLRSRGWERAASAAGIEGHTLHDLRDYAASTMARAGLPVATVSRYLGHANPAITLRVYIKFFREDDDRAAEALDEAMGRVLG